MRAYTLGVDSDPVGLRGETSLAAGRGDLKVGRRGCGRKRARLPWVAAWRL